MTDSFAESDIACPQCRSTNLVDLGPDGDPCRHSLICKECGNYFEYPPKTRTTKSGGGRLGG
jgi:hypothetical protein